MKQRYDTIVIGAGVVGASTARRLAAAGADVCLLDAHHTGGRGSRAAAGVGVPSVRLLGDPEMLAFAEAGRKQLRADLEELTGGEPGLLRVEAPVLRLVRDGRHRAELESAAAGHPDRLGTWLEAGRLGEAEPLLDTRRLHGAYLDTGGMVLDADAYVTRLQQAACAGGADVRLGVAVHSVEPDATGVRVATQAGRLSADRVVVAAGAWSGALAGLPPLPVAPLRGQMLRLDTPSAALRHVVSGSVYAAPAPNGTVVVGATEEPEGRTEAVTPEGLLVLGAFLSRTLPRLAAASLRTAWSGLRAATPDGRPLLGPLPGTDRVVVAAGHGGQGLLTGALTGHAVTALLCTGHDEWCTAFSPDRTFADE
ncbi:NAD(P)/FAD-dependent oxidoreductase [Streptomyces huiliensis]|uniref:NAD(P)/FAD-dependent oxidoreductase n=1 Tax=Streptomyces huiliensis TaxID=2876027 RepID=UPI001CC167F5|nr:FAD-binding oxidoreductase [Streptomyces huiliensis]MBZ4319933.1 FAD-binding oxidoreductase [Streptomyces huiliensis]